MAASDLYKKQHEDLLAMATNIAGNLNTDTIKGQTDTVLNLLSELAAKLNTHLSMEDKALYPKLINSGNAEAKATAESFQKEMGGIKQVFEAYVNKWSNPANLKNESEEFIKATKELFSALGSRIDKENNILYPFLDSI